MGFVIDTCIWVDVERGALAPADVATISGDEPVYLSPVTIAELKFGAEIAKTPEVRQKRLASIHRLLRKPILRIDEVTGDIFGSLAAALRSAGRGAHTHRIQDLWIASQAIQHGMKLLTQNEKDFTDIPGLDLVLLKPAA
ncbi:MAG: type II toxin-antitoxin system VapC family toxin [Chromatiales bacterium]